MSKILGLSPLHETPEWGAFVQAAQAAPIERNHLRVLTAAGLHIDLSAQAQSTELTQASGQLLQARQLDALRRQLFEGQTVNSTEDRPAWHTALRRAAPPADIAAERERMLRFVRLADAERRWRNVVHIGIGGSDWPVRLMINAFGYTGTWRNVRFVANIDGHAIEGGLAGLDPRETLVVIASKSFTTHESRVNGQRALEWLRNAGIAQPFGHIVAITARPDVAQQWGVPASHIFTLWDWVGGRFSLWSSIGLTAALAVGIDTVAGMQAGAASMDQHFSDAPFEQNVPVQMALAGIVNRCVRGYGSLNIAPYDSRLAHLVPYLQQLEMESLGKSVDVQGRAVKVPTGPAVWGMPGTDAQHTFFQWLHQGSDGAPVDFILCRQADHAWPEHHVSLMANCLAQREALLDGKSLQQATQECLNAGLTPEQAAQLAPHRVLSGGRPSTLIVLPRLLPFTLGALLALYEHKIFVQGVVWGINPFDQWGVEYGKVLAQDITQKLQAPDTADTGGHDASTQYWIQALKQGKAS